MEKEKLLSWIKKLKEMQRFAGPEADNAKRIMQNLIDKYELNQEEIEQQRKKITFRLHRLKKYGIHLACFCRIPHYAMRGAADYIVIDATPDEYKMYYELLGEIKFHFNKQERIFTKKFSRDLFGDIKDYTLKRKNDSLKSFMAGFMNVNYPYDKNVCPQCFDAKLENGANGFFCPGCKSHFSVSHYHNFGRDPSAFQDGLATVKQDQLGMHKLAIGHQTA